MTDETGRQTTGAVARSRADALRIERFSKAFDGTQALDDVSFTVGRATIHALLGGNGSGKSTLVKILSGYHSADAGAFVAHGTSLDARQASSSASREAGLRFVHQQPAHFLELTVAENLMLGSDFAAGFPGRRIHWPAVRRKTREILDRFQIDARPDQELTEVGAATRTMIEIARALHDQEQEADRILVLDEPTASLPRAEVSLLTAALRRYADGGQTIVFVTHRLEEVLEIADAATVIRDGRIVETLPRSEMSHDRLVLSIIGRPIERLYPEQRPAVGGEAALNVRDLTVAPVRDLDFDVRRGEILGLAGLVGSGRSEALMGIFGGARREAGTVMVSGRSMPPGNTAAAVAAGLALVPEDRAEAAFPEMTLTENISAASVSRYWRAGIFHHGEERTDAEESRRDHDIKARSVHDRFTTLSGGNQQKAILARWLRLDPAVLLLDEPTQGVDVGARAEIYRLIREAAEEGTAVVLVSSDLEELAHLSDRVVFLAGGSLVGELTSGEITQGAIEDRVYAAAGAGSADG
jgi:ribose transport system ATP-binding protein